MSMYLLMISYWIFFNVILTYIYLKTEKKVSKRVFIFIGASGLFLIMALRHETVGTDLLSYKNEFVNADYYLEKMIRSTELGYSYFNYFLHKTGLSFQVYLALISLIIVYVISKLFYLYSKNILLSYHLYVTIGLFAMTMSGLRQSLAISLTILSFIYLLKNRKKIFFLFVGIAYWFHNSAIIFLIVYLIRKVTLSRKNAILIYILSASIYLIKNYIAIFIFYVLPEKYIRYWEGTSQINPIVVIVSMIIPLACIFFWPSKSKNEESSHIVSVLFVISCINFIVHILAIEILMFERMALYFSIYTVILIPNIISGIADKNIRAFALLAAIILPLIQFLISTPNGSMGIEKYLFFWEKI